MTTGLRSVQQSSPISEMKRTTTAELLDTDSGTPEEVAGSLADLRRINRWFGGLATSMAMLQRVAEQSKAQYLSILEVAAGASELPRVAGAAMRRRGVDTRFTALDRAATHLQINNGSRGVVGDALALPFADASFDVVCSNLFVHHLAPAEVVQFVNESLRVARIVVLINDLIRHPMHLALVYAGTPLYRSRLTRHDAPASVSQAYTPGEMTELLKQTGASRIEIERHFLFRMGVVIWK
jgi:2-polyprenyl-3-methyl-5-hydroxy-6-metoxy-1,4-benzoquinol methylase